MAQAPATEAIKNTAENLELEKAKQYYAGKNREVEQLIRQVMTGEKTSASDAQPKILKPESVESLLKFLIYVVMNQEDVKAEGGGDGQQAKSLLDMIKTDEKLRSQIFGQLSSASN